MNVVLVTGASSGIGKEYARQFAYRGYNLLLVARREELLKEIAEEFKGQGYGKLKGYVADVVCAELEKIQARYREIMESRQIEAVLEEGAKKAALIADAKLEEVKRKIGLEIKYKSWKEVPRLS